MRKILALLVLGCGTLAHAQVIGLNPTPMAVYYWNTSMSQWTACTNSSTANPFQSTPQAFALEGFNSSLHQWTPQTSCPGSSSGAGLTSFQGRTTAAAVLLLSDANTVLKTATNCNVAGGYTYSPYSNSCILSAGGVTSVSGLSPLFTVTNPTSTPTFVLSNAAQNTVFAGPATTGAGIPNYRSLVAADISSAGTLTNSISGNAATATALAGTPGLCSTGQAPTGILANGTATGCAAIGTGSGTLSGQTTGYLPLATGATASTTSSALQDTGSSLVYHGTGSVANFGMPEGGELTPTATQDIFGTSSTNHCWEASYNGDAISCVARLSTFAAPPCFGCTTPGTTLAASYSYPGNKHGIQLPMSVTFATPGLNAGTSGTSQTNWSLALQHQETYLNLMPGIGETSVLLAQGAKTGDQVFGTYTYANAFGGQVDGSGEDINGNVSTTLQDGFTSGLSANAGTGLASLSTTSIACNGGGSGACNNPGHLGSWFVPGGMLLNLATASATPSITGLTSAGSSPDGVPTMSYTTTGGLSASTAYGAISSCTVPGAWSSGTTYPQYATVKNGQYVYASLSAGNLNHTPPADGDSDTAFWGLLGAGQTLGSSTCTVTLGGGSGNVGTSTHAHIAGPWVDEVQVTATAGSPTTSMTFLSRFAWDGVTSAFGQGGTTNGQALVLASTAHNPIQSTDWPVAYPIIAVVGSRVYFANCRAGQCNGTASSNIIQPATTNITFPTGTLTRTSTAGGTVTLTGLASNAQYRLREMSVGQSIVVSGSPGAAFDGTFTVATNTYDHTNPVVTWLSAGSNTTTTTFSVAQANPQIAIYPSANIVGVQTTAGTPPNGPTPLQGTAILSTHSMTTAVGDLLVSAPASEIAMHGQRVTLGRVTGYGPQLGGEVFHYQDPGPTPFPKIGFISNAFGNTSKVGGVALQVEGSFVNPFTFLYRPADGSDLLHMAGNDPVSGVSNICYGLFHDTSSGPGGCGVGNVGLSIYPATNTLGVDGNFYGNVLTAGNTQNNPYVTIHENGSSAGEIKFNGPGGGNNVTVTSSGFGDMEITAPVALTITGGGGGYPLLLTNPQFSQSISLGGYGGSGPAIQINGGSYGAIFSGGGVTVPSLTDTGALNMSSGQVVNWNSDLGLSRDSAGVLDVGNGTAGDKSGQVNAAIVEAGPVGTGAASAISPAGLTVYASGSTPIATVLATGQLSGHNFIPTLLYSAAGAALPACNSSDIGLQATVSDATTPLYMTAYTSGGTITAAVICSANSGIYTWLTH